MEVPAAGPCWSVSSHSSACLGFATRSVWVSRGAWGTAHRETSVAWLGQDGGLIGTWCVGSLHAGEVFCDKKWDSLSWCRGKYL